MTLFLVMNAFEIEGLEAQLSMCLVRGVHSAVYWSLFVGMLTPPNLPAVRRTGFSEPRTERNPAPMQGTIRQPE